MLVLLFVTLWFILRGDLLYVFPCVILFLCFSVLLILRLPRLGKRELILVLFVRFLDLYLFGFVGFLFLLGSGKGCGLWLWHSLDFSLNVFFKHSERRKLHKLFLFYKMQNGLAPDYLVDLVPPRVGNETSYSLRNADNYQQAHATSRLYFDSFLPSTIREWNNLPADVKAAQNLTSFKYKFERDTPKIPYILLLWRQT